MPPHSSLRVYFISEIKGPRYLRCLERINELGFEPVHVPAIRPTAFGEECEGSLRTRHWGSPLTLGEVGCFLAHRSAWQRIAETEAGPVLVVEDDVGFLPGAREVFLAAAARYDRRRDWVRFYSDWVRCCFRGVSLTETASLGIPFSPGNCSVAYMIGPEVARRFYANSQTLHCPSDDYMGQSWTHGTRELHCQPFPCIHDDGRVSLIGHRPKHQRLPFWPECQRNLHKLKISLQKRWAFLLALTRPV
jgi:glycosyl transferase family 25